MATQANAQARHRVHPVWYAFWAGFVVASLYFLGQSIVALPEPEMQPGSTLWNHTVWYLAHAVVALPILVIAPFQFVPGLRQNRPQLHRWLGRVFLANCMVAAILGIYLGSTIQWPGSRIPLSILGALWFLFAAIAWQAARRRDFANHRRFAIRAFALGGAFVWVRLINQAQSDLLGFIPIEDTQETTKEWLTLTLPIIVTELWLGWGPVARKLFARAPR
ncbi:DUF2306 domain-containing protein [Porphyrobacter sp. LM 6]|uniref:DUF2306 domain-containing protein n=1 Tax=Porphyrobacter sp. LM 6 TaxID=1896196 RepID=UPI000846E05E|nr:DUF2306 domain-containing protein [Porphyrobacter sp. LM 6]AOL94281.1 putative membrane protein [Porphyrobacter sp. LM 6]